MPFSEPFAAILLAGGRSRRLAGIDKTALRYQGRSLLERAADSVTGSAQIVLVGPPSTFALPAGAVRVQEEPPFSGPAAGLIAGVNALRNTRVPTGALVVVLACDLIAPAEGLAMLAARIPLSDDADGVAAVDDEGNRQPLLAVYRLDALRGLARDSASTVGRSLRSLLAPLRIAEVRLPSFLCTDIDTEFDARTHHLASPFMPDSAIGE